MGYQFEKQYLNEGNVQALFEFIPTISGLDQGLFVPSFTLFNGIRSNKSGLEFAIGPSINISKSINKYLYEDEYYTYEELQEQHPLVMHGDLENEFKADSRGNPRFTSYIVLAAGYSFKSGKLYIPANAFVVPSKENLRFGISFGFNTRR